MSAIASSSVDTMMRSIVPVTAPASRAASMLWAMSGLPQNGRMFLRGSVTEPPRAVMRARTSIAQARIDPSVRELFFCRQLLDREQLGNPVARSAVPIDRIAFKAAMRQLLVQGIADLPLAMPDVHNVATAVATSLPAADIDGRHAEIGGLADAGTGIPHDALGPGQQVEEGLWRHVSEEVNGLDLVLLSERANGLARQIGAGVDVRPKPKAG